MSRESEFETLVNPATSYVAWASNEKSFRFYDKLAKEKTVKSLPLEFIILKQGSAVKGWDDNAQEGIYSNIITNVSSQEFRVRSASGLIATGLYKDIKETVKSKGAHYEAKVFALCNGEIIMIELKGAVLGEWSTFLKSNSNKLVSYKVIVKKADDRKKGAVKYSVPIFEIGKALTKEEMDKANESYDLAKAYLDKAAELSEVATNVLTDDPLPDLPELREGSEEEDDLVF